MFLYLGDGKYKKQSCVIGIFDMDTATVSSVTRRFLSAKEREGMVESDGELPKSFLLCEERINKGKNPTFKQKPKEEQKKECSVFLSRLSSTVLSSRTASIGRILTEEE